MNYTNLKYSLTFHTMWHSGSGQSRGADIDSLVVKDNDGLPFIPGKTIKGLVREAIEEMMFLQGKDADASYRNLLIDFLGNSADHNLSLSPVSESYQCMSRGSGFFTNACLDQSVAAQILNHDASRFLYKGISRTKIDDNGIASNHSLRRIEVVVPCVLYGEIYDIPEPLLDDLSISLGFIKRLGLDRNRGLGRCTISIIKEGGNQ